jgi:hypothetical protein
MQTNCLPAHWSCHGIDLNRIIFRNGEIAWIIIEGNHPQITQILADFSSGQMDSRR